MEFLALIPARYASTRFPGKPLAMIAGKPMIQHVYERASEFFDHCYVATDDRRIAEAVESFGGSVVMTSPDHRSGTDRCAEALDLVIKETERNFDVIVNIQGDEPFICPEHLAAIKKAFTEGEGVNIATLVKEFGKDEDIGDPNKPKVVIDKNGFALYFSRSVIPYLRGVSQIEWQYNFTFLKHIGLYAYRSETLREITRMEQSILENAESLEQLRWLQNGYRIKTVLTDSEALSVDTPEDLQRILQNLK